MRGLPQNTYTNMRVWIQILSTHIKARCCNQHLQPHSWNMEGNRKIPELSGQPAKLKIIHYRIRKRFCLHTKLEKVISFLCMFERKQNRDRGKGIRTNTCLGFRLKVRRLALGVSVPPLWVVKIELIYSCSHYELFYALSHPTGLTSPPSQLVRHSVEWWDPNWGKGQYGSFKCLYAIYA